VSQDSVETTAVYRAYLQRSSVRLRTGASSLSQSIAVGAEVNRRKDLLARIEVARFGGRVVERLLEWEQDSGAGS
jgi:hypothetical protein